MHIIVVGLGKVRHPITQYLSTEGLDVVVIRGMHITKWNTANEYDVDETRERVLLARKS